MQVQKIQNSNTKSLALCQSQKGNNVSFKAKIIRNTEMNEAINNAKNNEIWLEDKYAFYNALDLIHNDFRTKTFKIESISSPIKSTQKQYRMTATAYNGESYTFTTSINSNDKKDSGRIAMKSIIDFIGKYYGNDMLAEARIRRTCLSTELDEKINYLLIRNKVLYDGIK